MQKKITFVGREHDPVLDNHIEEQLGRLERFLKHEKDPVFIDMVVEFHERHQFNKVSIRIKTPHYSCYAEHEGPDVFLEINEVVGRVYEQLRNEKEKLVDTHRHGCGKECRTAYFQEDVLEIDEEIIENELKED
ncbi:MAG: HPF/RaiA family ribosome-associated protein [Candidatus Babeliaceae bacterium]|nr:HPF/RaiA family ribosome-associated protein [Candidatus Babeliaceae bacterium]